MDEKVSVVWTSGWKARQTDYSMKEKLGKWLGNRDRFDEWMAGCTDG